MIDRPVCPYCEDGGYMMQTYNGKGLLAKYPYRFRCNVCGASTPRARTLEKALLAARAFGKLKRNDYKAEGYDIPE